MSVRELAEGVKESVRKLCTFRKRSRVSTSVRKENCKDKYSELPIFVSRLYNKDDDKQALYRK